MMQIASTQAAFGARLVEGEKKLWLHPNRMPDFLAMNIANNGGNIAGGGLGLYTPQMNDALLKRGYVADYLGVKLIQDITVPETEAWMFGPAEFVGLTAIRTDMAVESMKDVNRNADVLSIYSDLGFLIRWGKGYQKLTV
jgi:hypothetical protein